MSDYLDIVIWAEVLDDFERTRIALENRIRSMAERKDVSPPMLALLERTVEMEKDAIKGLEGAVKTHPLGPWVKGSIGIGLKQGGRLLAALNDPSWNTRDDRPRRGPAELWAYCGYHTVEGNAPQRERGVQNNWNSTAKMRAFLIAEQCIKYEHSPYRPVYDAARAKYAEATHSKDCRRCGPSGHPAKAGSPLNLGHQHARALRAVAKAILRDLFMEAQRVRGGELVVAA